MKAIAESPAILTVHRNGSQYLIRIDDMSYRDMVIKLTGMLPGAESLVLITPTSVKMFTADGQAAEASVEAEPEPAVDPMEEAMRIAQAEEHAIPGGESPTDIKVVGETPQGTKVVRRKKAESVAGISEPCGRCRGKGSIQMLLDGGVASETACPICHGEGEMKRFGKKR